MQKKSKRLILFFAFIALSSVVLATEYTNGVVFILPAGKMRGVTSMQSSTPVELKAGQDFNPNLRTDFSDTEIEKQYGIYTPSGTSLVQIEEQNRDFAEKNILTPLQVHIFPEHTFEKKSKSTQTKQDESVLPLQFRIYPLENPMTAIIEAERRRRLVSRSPFEPLEPPEVQDKERPEEKELWTGWILEQLQDCEMNANEVMPLLYWMTNHKQLTQGHTDCSMKRHVAKYLQKCHPWPIEYYTPVNNDIVVPIETQLAVEYLENTFETKNCPVIDLTKINFEKVDFLQGNLLGADFSDSYFNEATFSGTNLSETLFENAELKNALFENLDLSHASFDNADLKYAHFHNVKADASSFNHADLQNAQFRNVALSFASFNEAKLQNVAFVDVRARRLNANKASFYQASFDNALLSQMSALKSVFSNISCKNCSFNFSDLDFADFYKASFDNITFDEANLEETNFTSAVFKGEASFYKTNLYKANFSDVDLTKATSLDIETLRTMQVDKKTKPPEALLDFDAAEYDVEIYNASAPLMEEIDRYSCTKKTCEDRLLGHASYQNLAVRAMTMISNEEENLSNQVWALCTMGCIAQEDKGLSVSQLEVMAEFLKRKIPWNAQEDLFKPYTPIAPEVQMALYLVTAPNFKDSLTYTRDLTHLDLRNADLSRADLTDVNLSNSFLAGADLSDAKTAKEYDTFHQVVIDEYTKFPKRMGFFKQFELPDSPVPPWWKPSSVEIIRDDSHGWIAKTETIPFYDSFIVKTNNEMSNQALEVFEAENSGL